MHRRRPGHRRGLRAPLTTEGGPARRARARLPRGQRRVAGHPLHPSRAPRAAARTPRRARLSRSNLHRGGDTAAGEEDSRGHVRRRLSLCARARRADPGTTRLARHGVRTHLLPLRVGATHLAGSTTGSTDRTHTSSRRSPGRMREPWPTSAGRLAPIRAPTRISEASTTLHWRTNSGARAATARSTWQAVHVGRLPVLPPRPPRRPRRQGGRLSVRRRPPCRAPRSEAFRLAEGRGLPERLSRSLRRKGRPVQTPPDRAPDGESLLRTEQRLRGRLPRRIGSRRPRR